MPPEDTRGLADLRSDERKTMKITLVLFAGLLLSGQTADVQILEASDAGLVWQVYQELTAVQKTWTDLNARIKKKYRAEGEIEYSRDFKAFILKSTSTGTSAWRDVSCPVGSHCVIGMSNGTWR